MWHFLFIHRFFLACVVLGLSLLATSTQAMTLRELRALEKNDKQGENYVNYYLVGVMEGVLETDAHRVRDGAKPTICLNGRRLQPSMARSLFDTELQRNDGVYGVFLLRGRRSPAFSPTTPTTMRPMETSLSVSRLSLKSQ